MKRTYFSKINLIVLFIFLLLPSMALAHQPRIVAGNVIDVYDPEVSKAYYGQLAGERHVYRINSDKPFKLYAGILVPDVPGQKRDIMAALISAGDEDYLLAVLDGANFDWMPMYEKFGADNYYEGPEIRQELQAANYEIRVWSSNNDSKYSLAIGEIETFPPGEIINSLAVIPELKRDFFGSSPFTFLKSPFGIGYVAIMMMLSFIFGFLYRYLVKRMAKAPARKAGNNIGRNDRLIRFILGVILLVLGIYTWNPVILFISGFCFFEAIFSWCGFYAAIGRHSCPINVS